MAAVTPRITEARRLVVKIGSALLVDEGGLRGAWLRALGRGLRREADPLRVGLFVAALLHLWPVASTSAFTSMPLSGWFFLLLGLGLAETGDYMQRPSSAPPRLPGGVPKGTSCPTNSSP